MRCKFAVVCVPFGPLRSYDFDENFALCLRFMSWVIIKARKLHILFSFAIHHDDFEHPVICDGLDLDMLDYP